MKSPLKVAYYDLPNFGDQLNRLLVTRVLPGIAEAATPLNPFERIDGIAVHALGSYLSPTFFEQFDEGFRGVVLGTGVGYDQFGLRFSARSGSFPQRMVPRFDMPLPRARAAFSNSYAVYWVRGPLTTRMLGLPSKVAIADAGYMLRQCDLVSLGRVARSGVAFMPHNTASHFTVGLREVCESLGFDFIDSRAPLQDVLERIGRAELLITEALHGAVIADALRTPWVPVRSSGAIHEMKWRDFTASIGLDYRPLDIRLRWSFKPRFVPSVRSAAKNLALRAGAALSRALVSSRDTAADLLRASTLPPMASADARLEQIDEQIAGKLEALRQDVAEETMFRARDSAA